VRRRWLAGPALAALAPACRRRRRRHWPGLLARGLAAGILAGCAVGGAPATTGVGELAGEWRGRWLGPTGHAVTALSMKPDGAYRSTMYLDGGDRVVTGVVTVLPSGRLRYQSAEGNGEVRVESASEGPALRFIPDGGGGGGVFRRVR
jgi:hypothetical protein